MRRIDFLGYTLGGLLVAVFATQGIAGAQDAPAEDETSPVAKTAQLSMPDQVAASKQYIGRMETMRDTIRRDLEEAREQRDVVKTLCLNDKLNQLDVALRSGSERAHALDLAAQRNDADLANHEFTILSVLFQRAQQLDAEAKQCIGKEIGFVGESSTTMDVDPNIAPEEAADYPDSVVIFQPPQSASLYR